MVPYGDSKYIIKIYEGFWIMMLFAQIIGLFAVKTFLLSYQQKKRKNIIMWNVTSRVLYIIQYLLLGAFEGAVLDILGMISSVAAQKKHNKIIEKYVVLFVCIINIIILAAGLFLYENVFSLFPIMGVILHTSAFWITNERIIRIVSFLGSPFWLIYNLARLAYGSAIGDILTMISIGTAICRYDIREKKEY